MTDLAVPPKKVRVGFNYPWSYNHCGADIGPNIYTNAERWKAEQKLEEEGKVSSIPLTDLFNHIDRNLRNLKRMGIEVVRFWLLANGYVYGGAPKKRNTLNPPPDMNFWNWDFTPPSRADRRFAYTFEELLKRCKAANMQIIPSLISFEFTGDRGEEKGGLASGGRADCINIVSKRSTFLNTILADLLKVSQNFKAQIYAWEVMNEPYWVVGPWWPSPASIKKPNVGRPEMNVFLLEATKMIEKAGFASTVGHRCLADLSAPNDLENGFVTGTKPQFHYYAKPWVDDKIPNFANIGFPFLGEFASALGTTGKSWSQLTDKGLKDTTLNRLKFLEDNGCPLALFWPDGVSDDMVMKDQIKLLENTRKEIVQYTGGDLPPSNE